MDRIRRTVLLLLSLTALVMIGAQGNAVARQVPDFVLKDLAGKDFKLSENSKGKAVLVDFWATWCSPCVKEVSFLNKLYLKYKDKGFLIVGISMDIDGDSVARVQAFVKKNQVSYPVIMGNEKVVTDFKGIRGLPTTFFIGRSGTIIGWLGSASEETLEKYIRRILELK